MGDRERDAVMAAEGRALLAAGADALPVLGVGDALFAGEHRLAAAVAAHRAGLAPRRRA